MQLIIRLNRSADKKTGMQGFVVNLMPVFKLCTPFNNIPVINLKKNLDLE